VRLVRCVQSNSDDACHQEEQEIAEFHKGGDKQKLLWALFTIVTSIGIIPFAQEISMPEDSRITIHFSNDFYMGGALAQQTPAGGLDGMTGSRCLQSYPVLQTIFFRRVAVEESLQLLPRL
jgi:hypothetical protein